MLCPSWYGMRAIGCNRCTHIKCISTCPMRHTAQRAHAYNACKCTHASSPTYRTGRHRLGRRVHVIDIHHSHKRTIDNTVDGVRTVADGLSPYLSSTQVQVANLRSALNKHGLRNFRMKLAWAPAGERVPEMCNVSLTLSHFLSRLPNSEQRHSELVIAVMTHR